MGRKKIKMEHIFFLLMEARKGKQEAEVQLIYQFEPLLNSLARQQGWVDEDCKQHLTIDFLLAIRRFDLNRYLEDEC